MARLAAVATAVAAAIAAGGAAGRRAGGGLLIVLVGVWWAVVGALGEAAGVPWHFGGCLCVSLGLGLEVDGVLRAGRRGIRFGMQLTVHYEMPTAAT